MEPGVRLTRLIVAEPDLRPARMLLRGRNMTRSSGPFAPPADFGRARQWAGRPAVAPYLMLLSVFALFANMMNFIQVDRAFSIFAGSAFTQRVAMRRSLWEVSPGVVSMAFALAFMVSAVRLRKPVIVDFSAAGRFAALPGQVPPVAFVQVPPVVPVQVRSPAVGP